MKQNKYQNPQEQKYVKDADLIEKNREIEELWNEEVYEKNQLYKNNENRAWIDSTF
ncbi:MAG: hypothetical protein KJ646_02240 [Nanoarchaeota archaeon]|nr:hypothetical protein [Nanoarchaeota archaeon]